jgi:hypothetical protein
MAPSSPSDGASINPRAIQAKSLDAVVEAFRSRPLDAGPYRATAGIRADGVAIGEQLAGHAAEVVAVLHQQPEAGLVVSIHTEAKRRRAAWAEDGTMANSWLLPATYRRNLALRAKRRVALDSPSSKRLAR